MSTIGEGKYVISVDNSNAISQLTRFEQSAKKTGDSTKGSFLLAASGALNLAGGLKGLYNEFDQLEKVQTRIKKTNLEVSRAQEELNKLTNEGKKGTLDYEQALQRLEIAKDRNSQANSDLFKGNMEVVFSIAQIGVGVPAAIKALEGLSAVKKILTATTWAETFAFLANPLFAIPTAAAIATAVGLVATNTWGLRDALFGSTEAINANTDAMHVYNGTMSEYERGADSATKTTNNLNDAMDHTISNLKKNDLSTELGRVQAQMADTMFLMGSLEQTYDRFRDAGVEGFVREIAKDDRAINNINKVKSAVISLYSIISGRALPKDALGPNISLPSTNGFIQFGTNRISPDTPADSRTQLGRFLSYSRVANNGMSFLGGQASKLTSSFSKLGGVNMTGALSKNLTAGLRRVANKGKHGMRITANTKDTLAEIGIGQSQVDILTAEGVEIPNYYNFGFSNVPRGGSAGNGIDWARFNAAGQAALDEAYRRRQVRENRILDFINRSGLSRSEVESWLTTEQGTDDLYAVIDYRNRLAGISTGTG